MFCDCLIVVGRREPSPSLIGDLFGIFSSLIGGAVERREDVS